MKEKVMKNKIALLVLVVLVGTLAGVAIVSAQQPQPAQGPEQPRPPHPPMDPLGDAMFPPEMIMQHTRDLNLTDEQKTFMRAEINRTTTRFNELQWQLQDAMEALHTSMKENTVNEQVALQQLDKVLDTEREIKRLHFGLAISIKNKLTAEQQAKLHAMMQQMHGPDGPGRGPGGPGGPGRGPGRGPGGPGPGGPPPGEIPEGNFGPMN
jgi:Spy/CpxP family protein refolding chaperone